jgi:hypothetical protein
MHPRVREVHEYLDQEYRALSRVLESIPEQVTRLKPSADAWCVADVVHHLAIIDRRICDQILKASVEAWDRGVGPDPITGPILPAVDLSRVLDRSRKIRNPRGDPPESMPVGHALGDLTAVHDGFAGWLQRAEVPDLTRVSFPHPAFGPLNGYEWIAFMGAHAHRHTDQIHEIVQQVGARP